MSIIAASQARNIIWGPAYDPTQRGTRRHEDKYDFLAEISTDLGILAITTYDVIDAMVEQDLAREEFPLFIYPYLKNAGVITALMEGGEVYPPYERDLFFAMCRDAHENRGRPLPIIGVAPMQRDHTCMEADYLQRQENLARIVSSSNWKRDKARIEREYSEALQEIFELS